MRTIGLIGGMSWESTIVYYRILNELVQEKLGGLNSSKCILFSVNFAEIEELQRIGEWEKAGEILSRAALALEGAGAEILLICTNTMHLLFEPIQASVKIPVVHIADATGERIISDGVDCVALLGTKFTMSRDFYKERLRTKFGLKVLVPSEDQQNVIHRVIYNELCLGKFKDESRRRIQEYIAEMQQKGARGIILGCTELGLIIKQSDNNVPVYDTTWLHAERAVGLALSKGALTSEMDNKTNQ